MSLARRVVGVSPCRALGKALGITRTQPLDPRLLIGVDEWGGDEIGQQRRRQPGQDTAHQIWQHHAIPEPGHPGPVGIARREENQQKIAPEIARRLPEGFHHARQMDPHRLIEDARAEPQRKLRDQWKSERIAQEGCLYE